MYKMYDNDPSLDLNHIIGIIKEPDSRCFLTYHNFKLYDLDAQAFLSFAKQDLKEDSNKGNVNALSNAKRAIECRIDELLSLMNFRGFAKHERWKFPQKLLNLETFNMPAPQVLRNLITSKRNLLEHEYSLPDRSELRNTIEIVEMYLQLTDGFIQQGYINTAEFPTATQHEEETKMGRGLSGKEEKGRWKIQTTIYAPYILSFDFENETLEITRSKGGRKTAESYYMTQSQDIPGTERWVNTLSIPKCEMNEVRELMLLLREKAS